jgi:hypothetical protein
VERAAVRDDEDEDLRDAAAVITFVAMLYLVMLVVMWAW